MPQVDLATRLIPYGLNAADVAPAMTKLEVAPGQQLRLTHEDPNLRSHARQLAPKQVADLKRIIGVPDEAISHFGPRIITRPSVFSSRIVPHLTAVEHVSLWNSARNAIVGHSSSVSPLEVATVNQWLARINPAIFIHLFLDITVRANAQLILAPDVHILFANDILVEQGGRIICQATITKFDCASLKGFDGPPAGTGTGTA